MLVVTTLIRVQSLSLFAEGTLDRLKTRVFVNAQAIVIVIWYFVVIHRGTRLSCFIAVL